MVWQKAHQFVRGYGDEDVSNLHYSLEEVSKLLDAYMHSILASDSCILISVFIDLKVFQA
jgi:hypothetical protein